jgi:phosphoserine phosphatase
MVENELEGAPLWAYGNSRGDLRMLRAADTGVNVGKLGALGRLRDFPGLEDTGPRRLDH